VFLMIAILTWVRWNLSVVLICICFIAREIEHFFHVFTGHLYLFFENSLFNSCAHFFIGLLILWELSFWIPYRFWILVPYHMNSWQVFSSILWAVS
jgi:histidinol phosphatase-like PHP family hydrolase